MSDKQKIIFFLAIFFFNMFLVVILQFVSLPLLDLKIYNLVFTYTIGYFLLGLITSRYKTLAPKLLFSGIFVSFLVIAISLYYGLAAKQRATQFVFIELSGFAAFCVAYYFSNFQNRILQIVSICLLIAWCFLLKERLFPNIDYYSGYENNRTEKKLPYQLNLYDTANQVISLERFRNKVVFIDFWKTTGCRPCIQKIPFFDSLHKVYRNNPNIEIISVFSGGHDSMRNLKAFMKKRPLKHSVFFDKDGELSEYYGINIFPTEIIFNGNGKILRRYVGFVVDEYLLQKNDEEIAQIITQNIKQ